MTIAHVAVAALTDARHVGRLYELRRRALGREPRDFADYARETVATGHPTRCAEDALT